MDGVCMAVWQLWDGTTYHPVLLKLEKLDLEQYASALVDDQGYDSLASLEGLTTEQAGELADAVKMKPGHKKRFIDGVV